MILPQSTCHLLLLHNDRQLHRRMHVARDEIRSRRREGERPGIAGAKHQAARRIERVRRAGFRFVQAILAGVENVGATAAGWIGKRQRRARFDGESCRANEE